MRAFHLEQQAPTLTSPAPSALINSSDLVFAWTAVPGASQYRWQLSPTAGFNTLTASQTTVTNSWSPTAAISDGSYYWRVQVLDGSSAANVLATSAPARCTKDGTAPTVRTVGPTSALPITRNADRDVQRAGGERQRQHLPGRGDRDVRPIPGR